MTSSTPFVSSVALITIFIFMSACAESDGTGTLPGPTAPSTPSSSEPSEEPGVQSSSDEPGVQSSSDEPGVQSSSDEPGVETEFCDHEAIAADAWSFVDTPADGIAFTATEEDGVTTATLDATLGGPAGAAASSWVYLDLLAAEIVDVADTDAVASSGWHLAFKRTAIRVNGGQSGPRGVHVFPINQPFEDITELPEVPRGSWETDAFIDEDCALLTEGRGTPRTAFSTWFDYDFETHTASAPENMTWVVYSMDTHATWRLTIDELENNGVYTLRWAPFAGRSSE